MSDGNGGAVPIQPEVCPVDPLVRPGECVSIHAQLEDIRKSQREHSRNLKELQKDVDLGHSILQAMAEKLDIIAAQHGMKPAKGRR